VTGINQRHRSGTQMLVGRLRQRLLYPIPETTGRDESTSKAARTGARQTTFKMPGHRSRPGTMY